MQRYKHLTLYLVPSFLLILAFSLLPILYNFFISFYDYNLKEQGRTFVGVSNYLKLFNDTRFISSLSQTVFFTVVSVFFEFVIGLLIAIFINISIKGKGIIRSLALLPWIIPTVVSAIIFKWMFFPETGLVSGWLASGGIISKQYSFFADGPGSWFVVLVSDIWKTSPFMAIILLAGLQTIPGEIYEAAEVDGAGTFKKFFSITLPLLKPTVLVALLFRTLDAFRVFDLVYIITNGGPGNATETVSVYNYKVLMGFLDFGYGAAISIATFVSIIVISGIYILIMGRKL